MLFLSQVVYKKSLHLHHRRDLQHSFGRDVTVILYKTYQLIGDSQPLGSREKVYFLTVMHPKIPCDCFGR